MKNKLKLKGQMKLYLEWPAYMSILLIGMNIWIYLIDTKAGISMSVCIAVYIAIVFWLYFHNKVILMSELIEFSTQYGVIQNQLLKELELPYIMVLEDGKIIWSNDAFRDEISGIGRKEKYINKLIPEINRSVFPENDDEIKTLELSYLGQEYTIDLRKVSLWNQTEKFLDLSSGEPFVAISFKNLTEINEYKKHKKEEQLIAGLIYIDNYDEVCDSVDEIKQSMLMALVERKITQYISRVHGIIKKLENDKFFIVIKRKDLWKLEEDKFSILDDVKTVTIGNERTVSLSIGLGLAAKNYQESYNYARVAIDLALARGGDQAVCKSKEDIFYFGGKTQQQAKNTRVKARVKAEALREFIVGADQVIAVGHKIADVDSFGAAVGIYRVAQSLGKPSHIVINEITSSVRPLYEAFINNPDYPSDMFLTSEQARHYTTDNTMVVLVDTNKMSMCDCPELLEGKHTIAVLDHHRQDAQVIKNAVLSYIEPYASSTCEMVAEILQYIEDGVKLKNIEADSMYAGIIIDTNNFMNATGVRTFEAAAFLRRNGADVTKVRKLFRDDMDSYKAKARAIQDAQVFREKFAFAVNQGDEGIESPTILGAQIANELLDISGIKASFVLTNYKGTIYVSVRSIDQVNVQVIAEKMGGGGHINVAGIQFTGISIEEAKVKIKDVLNQMIELGDL